MTSRPSLLLWTSTRRVVRPPPTSKPRMVTCKCSMLLRHASGRSVGSSVSTVDGARKHSHWVEYIKISVLTSLFHAGNKEPVSGHTTRQLPSNMIFSWYV